MFNRFMFYYGWFSLSLSPSLQRHLHGFDHRGSGIWVVTCLKYHDIMTKSWKSHTLIPMLTPWLTRRLVTPRNRSQRRWGSLKPPTRWRNNCNKLRKKQRLLSKHVRPSSWSSKGLLLVPKVTGMQGIGSELCLQFYEVEAKFIKLHVS